MFNYVGDTINGNISWRELLRDIVELSGDRMELYPTFLALIPPLSMRQLKLSKKRVCRCLRMSYLQATKQFTNQPIRIQRAYKDRLPTGDQLKAA